MNCPRRSLIHSANNLRKPAKKHPAACGVKTKRDARSLSSCSITSPAVGTARNANIPLSSAQIQKARICFQILQMNAFCLRSEAKWIFAFRPPTDVEGSPTTETRHRLSFSYYRLGIAFGNRCPLVVSRIRSEASER